MSLAPTNADLTVEPAPAGADTGQGGRRFSLNLRQSGIYIAFAVIIVLFTVLTGGDLLAPQNISNIIVQNSYILILAIGMILVIIAGHIDLSVGSVVAACGAVSGVLMVNHHMAWPLALVLTLAFGAVIGNFLDPRVLMHGVAAAGLVVMSVRTLAAKIS